MGHILMALLVVGAMVFTVGCSKSSGGGTTGPTDLTSIPDATGPVVASGSSVSQALLRGVDLQLATTGIKASQVSGLTWGSSQSGPFCQAGNMTLRLIAEAAKSDKIKCYMAAAAKNSVFTPLYDGADHYLQFANNPMGTPRVKYNGTKDSSGNLTSFKMWMCFNSGTQDEYVGSALASDGTVTLTSVGTHSQGGFSGAQKTVASGKINSSAQWVGTKTITHKGTFSGSAGGFSFSHNQGMSAVFTDTQVTLDGYFSGSYGTQNNTGALYTIMQLLNASSLTTLAFGGGTTKFDFNWGTNPFKATKAWDGDTRAPLSDATAGDFYASVNDKTLSSVQTISITFDSSAGETWDCAAATTATSVDMLAFEGTGAAAADKTACDAKYFDDQNNMRCEQGSFN